MLLNLTRGVPNVSVSCMASVTAGCAHDYQMTSDDRRLLADSNVVVINGAGLEPYLDSILPTLSGLVIDSSSRVELIQSKSEHGGVGPNPHIWVSIPRAISQLETIASGLIKVDPANADLYSANLSAAREKLRAQFDNMRAALAPYEGARVATFHPAFDYFAADFGLIVAASLTVDPDTPLSARELAGAINILNEQPARALFVEPGEIPPSAQVVQSETGIPIYELSSAIYPMVGVDDADCYIAAMDANLRTLMEALR
jgi:zinc transport system substrate-binding protein